MQINKIKQTDEGIVISYDQHTGNEGIKSSKIVSPDEPRPEFSEAMRALLPDFREINEYPDNYGHDFIVRGVSFQYNNKGNRTVVISATRVMKVGPPKPDSTPKRSMDAEQGDAKTLLKPETLEALKALEAEALEYINGERQQQQLGLVTGKEEGAA